MCGVKRAKISGIIHVKKWISLFRKMSTRSLACHLSAITVTSIFQSFTHKMAAKTRWYRYGTKFRHCHPMYRLSVWFCRFSTTRTMYYSDIPYARYARRRWMHKLSNFIRQRVIEKKKQTKNNIQQTLKYNRYARLSSVCSLQSKL